jgi:hypothetical protein
MQINWLLKLGAFAFVVFLIWLLARLTATEEEDPCANPQTDISGAVLGESEGDQDALVNRAIILRGKCEPQQEQEKPED